MKDKNNLFKYDLWSSGEYSDNLTDFNPNIVISNSNFSIIGEKCLNITNNTNDIISLTIPVIPVESDKTYTLSCDILTENTVNMVIQSSTTGRYVFTRVTPSNDIQSASVSYIAMGDDANIQIRWNIFTKELIYMDNLELTVS